MNPAELQRFQKAVTDIKEGAGEVPVILNEERVGIFKSLFLKWGRWQLRRGIRQWCQGMGKLEREWNAEKKRRKSEGGGEDLPRQEDLT